MFLLFLQSFWKLHTISEIELENGFYFNFWFSIHDFHVFWRKKNQRYTFLLKNRTRWVSKVLLKLKVWERHIRLCFFFRNWDWCIFHNNNKAWYLVCKLCERNWFLLPLQQISLTFEKWDSNTFNKYEGLFFKFCRFFL